MKKSSLAPPRTAQKDRMMVTLDEIAKVIWRDTYRHDTLLEWHEIKRNTMHWKRVMAAAETVRYLLTKPATP